MENNLIRFNQTQIDEQKRASNNIQKGESVDVR